MTVFCNLFIERPSYNKLYLYTIGLHTDTHIMQEHIKGPYSEILQKHENNTRQEEKPKK